MGYSPGHDMSETGKHPHFEYPRLTKLGDFDGTFDSSNACRCTPIVNAIGRPPKHRGRSGTL